MTLRFGSFCSGIGAPEAGWVPLGFKPAFFSEIEPFPCAVLAHHYPDVPNLGDMTKITDEQIKSVGPVDVVVAGTPCQSFSVAGLRKGLDDPRGNLALTFLGLVNRIRPRWIVWENVPGVLSSEGGEDFKCFLDGVEEIGYIPDIEILDAQYFGVPQRRRRVFVCAQSLEDFLSKKTNSSALTIGQCLIEILHGICKEECIKFGSAPANSASPAISRDGARRRMKLFDLPSNQECNFGVFMEHLADQCPKSPNAQNASESLSGRSEVDSTAAGRFLDSHLTEGQFSFTASEWRARLDESWEVVKSFTTLTSTRKITESEIFTCSQACLLIAKHIAQLNPLSPGYWSAASSALTAIQEFTEYARSASSCLFGDMGRFQAWHSFIREAEPAIITLGNIGIECFGKILPIKGCLSGNPAPSREERPRVAAGLTRGADSSSKGEYAGRRCEDDANIVTGTLPSRSTAGGGLGTDFDCDGGLIVGTLNANGKAAGSATQQDAECGMLVTHSLTADGFDASEDGTGRGTPLVPVAFNASDYANGQFEESNTSRGLTTSADRTRAAPIIAFQSKQSSTSQSPSFDEVSPTLDVAKGGGMAVAYQCQGSNVGEMGTLRAGNGNETGGVPFIAGTLKSCGGKSGTPNGAEEVDRLIVVPLLEIGKGATSRGEGPNGCGIGEDNDPMFTLQAGAQHGIATAFQERGRRDGRNVESQEDVAYSLTSPNGGGRRQEMNITTPTMMVRRLTPTECERLQGFEDGWTKINFSRFAHELGYEGKATAKDGPRYRAIGNSMAVPVLQWIGKRIMELHPTAP